MNSYNIKVLQGSILFSGLFLGICLLIVHLLPAAVTERPVETKSVVAASEFNSNTVLQTAELTEDYFIDAGFKTDYSDDYSPREDKGLALYRQPMSRPAVEWFYTHITSSREVAQAILENADKNDIPLSLAFALAYVESNYKASAVNTNTNYTVDRGLFQLNSASFPNLTEEEFFNPNTSAFYGMKHLRYCMDIAGNEITALAMYNAGAFRVKNNNTPQHTLNYVAKISKYRGKLEGMFTNEVVAFYDTDSASQALAFAN